MSDSKDVALAAAGSTIPVTEFASRFREEMVPLNNVFSYFFLAVKPTDAEMKEFVEEPVLALPPSVVSLLPRICLLFVPHLDRLNHRRSPVDLVSLVRPAKPRTVARAVFPDLEALLFAFEDRDAGEHHYRFFQSIASIVVERGSVEKDYLPLIRQELRANVHGEVDELSWEKKIQLLERQSQFHGSNKALREYAKQSLIDTLTLYLHGICCDLDVETGPRQLASRHLRKRLELLEVLFPPPKGYAVFPEELRQ
jgi:hypothetical protein